MKKRAAIKNATTKFNFRNKKRKYWVGNFSRAVSFLREGVPTVDHLASFKNTPFKHIIYAILAGDISEEYFKKNINSLRAAHDMFDSSTAIFTAGEVKVPVNSEYFRLFYGIVDGNLPIDTDSNIIERTEFYERCFQDRINHTGKDPYKLASHMIEKKLQGGGGVVGDLTSDDFARLTCLYILCTLLIPAHNDTISLRYIKYLDKMEEICFYNWSEACFKLLVKGFKNRGYVFTGCGLFLQHMLCEYSNILGRPNIHSFPRCFHWNLSRLGAVIRKDPEMENVVFGDRVPNSELEQKLLKSLCVISDTEDESDGPSDSDSADESQERFNRHMNTVEADVPSFSLDYQGTQAEFKKDLNNVRKYLDRLDKRFDRIKVKEAKAKAAVSEIKRNVQHVKATEASSNKSILDLKQTVSSLQTSLETMTADNTKHVSENNALVAERNCLISEKKGLLVTIDELVADKKCLVADKESLIADKEILVADKESLVAERDKLIREYSELNNQKTSLERELAHFRNINEKLAFEVASPFLSREVSNKTASTNKVVDDAVQDVVNFIQSEFGGDGGPTKESCESIGVCLGDETQDTIVQESVEGGDQSEEMDTQLDTQVVDECIAKTKPKRIIKKRNIFSPN